MSVLDLLSLMEMMKFGQRNWEIFRLKIKRLKKIKLRKKNTIKQ